MKFKTLAVTFSLSLGLLLSSTSVNASKVQFELASQDLETKACYLAATKGISAVKNLVRSKGLNFNNLKTSVLCNGQRITPFAAKYVKARIGDPSVQKQTVKVVSISSLDQTPESKLCLDAVTIGEQAARQKHDLRTQKIQCNGKEISKFLKTFKNKKIVKTDANNTQVITS